MLQFQQHSKRQVLSRLSRLGTVRKRIWSLTASDTTIWTLLFLLFSGGDISDVLARIEARLDALELSDPWELTSQPASPHDDAYRAAAIAAYYPLSARSPSPYASFSRPDYRHGDSVACMVTGELNAVTAHILPRSARHGHLARLGLPATAIHDPRNLLFLLKPIERAFDDRRLSFLPTGREYEYVVKLWDPALKANFACRDGDRLHFGDPLYTKPFTRCLEYQARRAHSIAVSVGWVPPDFPVPTFGTPRKLGFFDAVSGSLGGSPAEPSDLSSAAAGGAACSFPQAAAVSSPRQVPAAPGARAKIVVSSLTGHRLN